MKTKQNSKKEELKKQKEAKIAEIANVYASLVEQDILFPTRADLLGMGVSRDQIRYYFGNIGKLRAEAKKRKPDSFSGLIDIDQYLSDENLKVLESEIKEHRRFFITTAVSGQNVHQGFLKSVLQYCDLQDAKLLILPSHDPAHNLDNEIEWHFDSELIDAVQDGIVFEETPLNSNIFISGIRVTAKQINPVTGLSEISQNKGSFIFASPKQGLEFDSVSANKLPHARMSTGAITLPNYKTTKGNSLRTAYLAEFQHIMGGIVVEIEDDNIYHFRQVQANKDGSFCDLGKQYDGKKIKKVYPTLVMGDYHAGEHDELTVSAWIEIINKLEIQAVVFHDMFNAISVNHHEEDDMMLRAERVRKGLNVLTNELILTSIEFDRILGLKTVKKGIVVKSNHDDMIDRWLRKAKYAKDPVNFEFGTQLSANLMAASKLGTKKDFFKTGLELTKNPKYSSKLQWLTVDEDYVVGGIHLGAHGDKAANGARGSIKSLAKSYPKCVIGHSHTPGIFKGAFQVGTTSLLRLGYNSGPSSWVHCSCLVYDNGQRQLIISINGKWRLVA